MTIHTRDLGGHWKGFVAIPGSHMEGIRPGFVLSDENAVEGAIAAKGTLIANTVLVASY